MTNLKNSRMGLNRKARVNRSKVDKASAWCVAIVLWVLCSSAAQVGEMKELNDSVCSNDDYWGNIDENPKTFMEAYDEIMNSDEEITENCADVVDTGCKTKQKSLNNANACINCPLNHTVCDCKKCVVRDYDCTLKTGVCRPKLIPYDIIKKCNQDSCENGGPAVVIIPTVLSVGCYCHTEDMDNQTTKIDQEEQKQHLAPKKRAFYRRALNRN
ncbi:uncharacterized protein LOC134856875 [Symsagittifera roscoffensis]|uniref:uncharacterized protein LOC134856875 n=1 Tax=Symsagittifera roscoffensis TaxID=84072 RepID=UPI00307C04AF